ncbi:PadR family transcriptional regulator [Mycolicibacterium komossense]|uniref:PadR family transcriptional regulator n=1 Tax=Mycolicibacterium komossense TaxID=1779 RepID=A0ABT3CJH4_9MYCO|nr:PadR family transcriptional regulator [Mycolicibacterium komossense]MCV7229512.1 PadR family transcriptional regulator [Mycolicibacterium komossense]
MADEDPAAKATLAATSWAILAILSPERELSGYDVKKVTEWSIRYFYWSPQFSQIYAELKKLEKLGLVTSRMDHDNGARNRRLYKITAAGLEAVTRWANDTPAEPPMLKHSVLLRVAFGNLAGPEKLKDLLQEHVEFAEDMLRQATHDAQVAETVDAWAYSRLALQWASRYYASERELALQMMKDLDEAEEAFGRSGGPGSAPAPRYWDEIGEKVNVEGKQA